MKNILSKLSLPAILCCLLSLIPAPAAADAIIEPITNNNFTELWKQRNAQPNVLVYFHAMTWCPCTAINEATIELLGRFQNTRFVQVNINENPNIARAKDYNIIAVPTFIMYRYGKEVGRVVTNVVSPIPAVEKMLERWGKN